MIRYRSRKYRNVFLFGDHRKEIIEWKKASRKKTKPFPEELKIEAENFIREYFGGFDIATVPAPTYHDYDGNYPIWELLQVMEFDIEPIICFPEKNELKGFNSFKNIHKQLPKTQNVKPGQFVLIFDDIQTTSHTMRVCCEAVCQLGAFPFGVSLC